MRSLYLLPVLALASWQSFAQTESNQVASKERLEGIITDKKTHAAVPSTVIVRKMDDSSMVAGTQTDSAGHYLLETNSFKNTFLKVEAIGYHSRFVQLQKDGKLKPVLDFQLEADEKVLKAVTVVGRKPLVEKKVDRTVYNVESSISSIGSDALEALKKTPGVRVTNTNDIAIAGKSTVSVMINDRLVQLSGEELATYLRSIPADQVSKIEVITAPPAKYDAAGNSGIINIVMKKSLKNGFNGNVTAGYQQHSTGAPFTDGSINYRYNKLNVFASGNYFLESSKPEVNYTVVYPDQRWVQHSKVNDTITFQRIQVGADYNLTSKSILGFNYTYAHGGPNWNQYQDITTTIYNKNNTVDSIIRTKTNTPQVGRRHVANLNYELKLDTTGKKLNIDLDYFNRKGNKTRDFITENFLADNSATGARSDNHTYGDQVVDIRSAKVDVAWPTKWANYGFGGKVSFIHNTSNNVFEYLDGEQYVVDYTKTNEFDYHENTQAIYFNAQKDLKKWSMQLGLRGEYTQTKGFSPTLNETHLNDYFQLFPSVFVQYKPGELHSYSLNYTRRIDRPSFWLLNPFRNYTTNNTYSVGNPYLQPSFSTNIELNYTYKSRYSVTLYSQWLQSMFTNVSVLDTANKIFAFKQANSGNGAYYGCRIDLNYTPYKWWEGNTQFNGFYSIFSSGYYSSGNVTYSAPAFFIQNGNSFFLNKEKTYSAEVNFFYMSSQQSGFDFQYAFYNLGFGAKALFMERKLVVAASVYDLLKTDRYKLRNEYNGTLQDSYWDNRTIQGSVTWKFGNSNIKGRRTRNSVLDESKRAG